MTLDLVAAFCSANEAPRSALKVLYLGYNPRLSHRCSPYFHTRLILRLYPPSVVFYCSLIALLLELVQGRTKAPASQGNITSSW